MYGICGEQYSLDVVFDDEGKVETTRFRFQHQPLKSQEDYIAGLVETRKATDIFASKLIPLDYDRADVDLNPAKDSKPSPRSLYKRVASRVSNYLGLSEESESELLSSEQSSPIVFCYSLFYVYYD